MLQTKQELEERAEKQNKYMIAQAIELNKWITQDKKDMQRMRQDLKDCKNRKGDYKPNTEIPDWFYCWESWSPKFRLYSEITPQEEDMYTEAGFEAQKNGSHRILRSLVNH